MLTNLFRAAQIAWILARYDLGFALVYAGVPRILVWPIRFLPKKVKGRRGERLAAALQAMGPAFIKFGQTLATRFDLIGKEMAADLAMLQDRLPPFPSEEAIAIIESEFGQPLEQVYKNFDPTPVAAASIAQVHRAELPDGTPVAVKISRPGINKAFDRDIALFRWIAHHIAKRSRHFKHRVKIEEVVENYTSSLSMERDFRFEAAAGRTLAENIAEDPGIRIPEIYWSHTSRKVMTLDWVDGIPVSAITSKTKLPADRLELATWAVQNFLRQLFRNGFFHADLHSGNMFIGPDGKLVPVDFGIMGRISLRERQFLADILQGFLKRDYAFVAVAHFAIGYVPADKDLGQFSLAIRAVAEPILNLPVKDISVGGLLGHLFSIAEQFSMPTQVELLQVQKSFVLLEALARRLCPEVNMWELARPVMKEWLSEQQSPLAELKKRGEDYLLLATRLPELARLLERYLANEVDSRGPGNK